VEQPLTQNIRPGEQPLDLRGYERAGGYQTQAAQLLGINRDQVRYRMEKFGLQSARGT